MEKASTVMSKRLVERLAGSVKIPGPFTYLEIEEIIQRAKKEYRESRGSY